MSIAIIAIILGFIALTWSADKFVSGAAAIAQGWGISPMLVGLTVVSVGTSAPEILVSVMAASQGHGDIAVGNAIGSNIANIGLVLGVTALIAPLAIKKAMVRNEIPWLVLITLVAGACLADSYLGVFESLALVAFLIITLYVMVRWQTAHPDNPLTEVEDIPDLSKASALVHLLGGLAILLASSQALVWGATTIATLLGISELVIGLTIVAIGTSLPELAASVMSALRNHSDIALGNVVGSNIFNLLAVLPVPGLIAPGALDDSVIERDYPVMLGLTLLLTIVAIISKQPKQIGRVAGVIMLASYGLYGIWLYIQNT